MGEQPDPCPPIRQGNDLSSPKILGDFYIENHHYLVISSEDCVENLTQQGLRFPTTHCIDSVVGQIKMQGQEYVVVEVEFFSLEDGNSATTNLLTTRELGRFPKKKLPPN